MVKREHPPDTQASMTLTHLHLVLNHLPVLGTAFGLGLLAFGIWRQSTELKKTALGIFVLVALMAVPVYLTGEPAEEGVEGLPGVSETIIEQHEEAAGVAFASIGALGVIALIGLLMLRHGKPVPAWFAGLMVIASLTVSGLMAWTANIGGQIRHTEIRTGAVTSAPASKDRD
tara:strand:+ start:188 stop:706 length:519 start_codon:yes stop_codon:yes gene_type:complete